MAQDESRGSTRADELQRRLLVALAVVVHHTGIARRRIAHRLRSAGAVVAPPLRRAGLAVLAAIDRAEQVIVPLLSRAGVTVLRAVDRAEQLLVPALLSAARGGRDAVQRVEAALIPGLTRSAWRALRFLGVVEDRAVPALAAAPAAVLDAVGRGEQRAAEAIRTRLFGNGGWARARNRRIYAPNGHGGPDLRHPVPRRAGTYTNLLGLLASAAVIVLATTVAADATVGEAVRNGHTLDFSLPLPDEVSLAALDERSVVYAADDSVLAVLDREVNRDIVPLDAIPEHVRNAVIAAEDRRFYEHDGYDPVGIVRAAVSIAESGEITQGASTITQQLARTTEQIGNEVTIDRKLRELFYAMRLEETFAKDELLGQYLNQVYFGEQSYGIAAAAEEYFGVRPDQLSIDQAALLAGLIRSPNSDSPRTNPEGAKRNRDQVLSAMAEEGYIDPARLPQLQALPLGVIEPQPTPQQEPHVVDAVRREFITGEQFSQFGATPQEREEALYKDGLQIYATVRPNVQQLAAQVLAQNYSSEPGEPTGAIAVVEPSTGRVLAAQGGLSYAQEQFDLAVQARRHPGSTFKPFVYAAALEAGFPPTMTLDGKSPAYFENIPGWTPADGGVENYGGASYGRLDMPSALRNSVNTATAQLALVVGIDRVTQLADRMGIDMQSATGGEIVPAIALGGPKFGMTPLEMASSYGTFANGGVHVAPHFIQRITDRNGKELYVASPPSEQALDPRVAAGMIEMMRGVVTGGTGTAARVPGWQVAGKTGTTQENHDAWFVGYTPTLATAMWMGHPEGQITMPGVTGGSKPARVWRQFMTAALASQEPVAFPDAPPLTDRLLPGEPVTVPDVRRMDETSARAALLDVRLVSEVRAVADAAPRGTVLWQSPRPGTVAETGDTITLGVSTGEPPPPEPTPSPTPSPSESEDDDGDDDSGDGDGGDNDDGDNGDGDGDNGDGDNGDGDGDGDDENNSDDGDEEDEEQ